MMSNSTNTNLTVTPNAAGDVFTAALANLAAAGVTYTEVAACPHPDCTICASAHLRHAA